MPVFSVILIVLNAAFFAFYGVQCFVSPVMKLEFERYGLTDFQRKGTGTLQLLGSAGVLYGFLVPVMGLLASSGLALMMLFAFIVRMKIRDGFLLSAPSLIFLALNMLIAVQFYRAIS